MGATNKTMKNLELDIFSQIDDVQTIVVRDTVSLRGVDPMVMKLYLLFLLESKVIDGMRLDPEQVVIDRVVEKVARRNILYEVWEARGVAVRDIQDSPL